MSGQKLRCPQCGAEIPPVGGSGLVVCPYCRTTLYLDLSQAVPHYYYPIHIERKLVQSLLSRWLVGRELTQVPRRVDVQTLYLPFWQIARGPQPLFLPAASFPIQELREMGEPGGHFQWYEDALEEAHEVVPPDIFLDGILEMHREELGPSTGPRNIFLIHVPLYRVTYAYGNAEYEAVVDAVQGRVFADSSPPLPQLRMDKYFTLAMVSTIALFAAELCLLPGFVKPLIVAGLTGIPLHFTLNHLLIRRRW